MMKFSLDGCEGSDANLPTFGSTLEGWEEAESGLLRETYKECELSRVLHHSGVVAEVKDSFRATLRQNATKFEYVNFDFSLQPDNVREKAVPGLQQDRYVRCYVISPFSDMQAERRLLAQEVFPTLRARCVQIGVHFIEIDFGWGVPQNIAERKSGILNRMLEMRQNVRTYVVGLVGERYGYTYYHDADVNQGFLDPLFISKRPTVLGLQEVELDEGPLSSDCTNKCFFYFRDARYFDQVDNADVRRTLACEGLLSRERLSNMKSKIRLSSIQIKDNYQDPEEVASLILADLSAQIAEDFPNDYSSETASSLDASIALEYETFILKTFQGREDEMNNIDERILAIQEYPLPTIICGESGCGKSALLVAWSRRFEQFNSVDFFFKHYASLNSHNMSWMNVLKKALDGLKSSLRLRTALPTDINQLAGAFASWINALPYLSTKVVFMLDGVDTIDASSTDDEISFHDQNEVGQNINWLPKTIPPNFRMLLSCATGTRTFELLNFRKWNVIHISCLDDKSRQNLIKQWVHARGIHISSAATDRIMRRQQAKNTLFLVQVLRGIQCPEDIRPSGSMGQRLFSRSVDEMADIVLTGLETNRGMQERGGLPEDFLSFIAVSRRGLSEFELLDLMQVPRSLFSKFFLEARQILKVCFGLFSFCHNVFETAVKRKYLQHTEVRKNVRLRLVEYFQSRQISHRTIEELPWQLYQCRQWQELLTNIMNPEIFLFLTSTEMGMFDLAVYWSALLSGEFTGSDLISKCDHCMSAAKESSLSSQERLNLYFSLAEVLQMLGFADASLPFERRAYELEDRVTGVNPLMQIKYSVRESRLLMSKNEFQRAQSILETVVKNLRNLVDTDGDGSISYEELRATEAGTLLLEMEEELLFLLWKAKQFVKLGGFCKAMLVREYDRPTNKLLLLDSLLFTFIQRGHLDSANEFLDACLKDAGRSSRHDFMYILSRKFGLLLLQEKYASIVALIHNNLPLLQSVTNSHNFVKDEFRIDVVAVFGIALCFSGHAQDGSTLLEKLRDQGFDKNNEDLIQSDGDLEEGSDIRSSSSEAHEAVISTETGGGLESWVSDIMLEDLLGLARRQLSQFKEAEECHRKALNLKILAYGASDISISFTISEMAAIYEMKRRNIDAITLRKVAAQICHDSHGYTSVLHFKALIAVASTHWKFREYQRAEQLALTVLVGIESRFGAHHEAISSAALILGMSQGKQDKIKLARQNLQRAQQLANSTWGPGHSDYLNACMALAELHELSGDFDLAETALINLGTERQASMGRWSYGSARDLLSLCLLYFRIGAFQEAEQRLRESLPGIQMGCGANALDVACILSLLAVILARAAESHLNLKGHIATILLRAYRIRRSVLGIDSPFFLQHSLFTALFLQHLSSYRFAEPLFRKSYVLLSQSRSVSTQLKQKVYHHYEACNKAGFSLEEWRPMLPWTEEVTDTTTYSDPVLDAILSDPSMYAPQELTENMNQALKDSIPHTLQQLAQAQDDFPPGAAPQIYPSISGTTRFDELANLPGSSNSDRLANVRPTSAPPIRTAAHPPIQRPSTAAGTDSKHLLRMISRVRGDISQASPIDTRLRLRMDPDLHDEAGNTSLHNAVDFDDIQAVRSLVGFGASVDARNRFSETPIHIAARRGKVEILRVLCSAGADVNAAGPGGNSALHYAVEADSLEVVQILCEHFGADISAENDTGLTPLQLAYTLGNARRNPIQEYLQRANELLPSF